MKEKNLMDIKAFERLSPSAQIHLKGMEAPPQGGSQSNKPPHPSRSEKYDNSSTYDSSDNNDKSQSYDNSNCSDVSTHHD